MKILNSINLDNDEETMFQKMKSKWKLRLQNQYVIAIIVSACHICSALAMSWTSPVLRKLHGPDSPLSREPTMQEEEWIGSLAPLGGLLGPIIVVPLWSYVGRRWLFIASNLPLLVGWALAGFATNLPMMYAARFLWGLTSGMHYSIIPIYIGEISANEIRGTLGVLFSLFINIGYFLNYSIGATSSYWGLTAVGGILTLIYVPTTFIITESPLYLVYKGHNKEALEVLKTLRGVSEESVQTELDAVQEMVDREFKVAPKIQDLWATRGGVKALGICVFLTALQQMSGLFVILIYLEELLVKMNTSIPPSKSAVIFGGFQLCSSLITPLIVDRLGRKRLMCISTFGLTVALSTIGVYELFADYYKYDVSSFMFLPLTCLIAFVILFMIGVGPVPWVLVSEMFPVKTKSIASGICSSITYATAFVWTRYFHDVTAALGIYSGFWILALFSGVGFVFSATVIPETKGRTFDEIQDILHNRYTKPVVPVIDTKNHNNIKFAF